ncbi:lactate utilization protein [Desulfothermus naphthae]
MNTKSILDNFWEKKLNLLKQVLEKNNFEVFIAPKLSEVKELFIKEILNKLENIKKVSFGGSLTVVDSGIYSFFKESKDYEVIDTYDRTIPKDEFIERRRHALLSDLFLTGTNAVTEDGVLVNLDGYGNRIGGIAFGPRYVTLLIGRNKVVADLDEAINRIKGFAAPINTLRLNRKNPCAKTLKCEDCNSPERVCNVWLIAEKCYLPKRIKIILINEDCGL